MTENQILERAKAYGYSNFFALLSREECIERLEYAKKTKDTYGIVLSMALLQNRNAYDKAVEQLNSEN